MMDRNTSREALYHALTDNSFSTEGKKLFIWGTGNTAQLYQEGLKRLEEEGFFIHGYCDNHMEKFADDQSFCGKPVLGTEELRREKSAYVLICTPQSRAVREITEQLDGMGIPNSHIDAVIFKLHAKEVMACYDALEDEESRDIYAELTLCRMNGRYPEKRRVDRELYFTLDRFRNANANEVFVDCGAFVGDVVERYIWNKGGAFGKIIAFEPDKGNYDALAYRVKRLKKEWNLKEDSIVLEYAGIGEQNGEGVFVHDAVNGGLGSKYVADASEGDVSRIYSIDGYMTEPFDFLKADIEGYEYQMLLGARESIRRYRPLLAVCIYHNAVDFYTILLLIKSIEPKYKFSLRHHTGLVSETVLYAWVEEGSASAE